MTVVDLILIILLFAGGIYCIHLCMHDDEVMYFVIGNFMILFGFLVSLDVFFI